MKERDDEDQTRDATPCPPTTYARIIPPREVTLLAVIAGVGFGLALGVVLTAALSNSSAPHTR